MYFSIESEDFFDTMVQPSESMENSHALAEKQLPSELAATTSSLRSLRRLAQSP